MFSDKWKILGFSSLIPLATIVVSKLRNTNYE
jgi:hypothetical protein